jgi:phospho-N-acetylmuramoyl-pentapeptide-transferase
MLIIGNPMIAWLQQKRWKQGTTAAETWTVREDTPDTHLVKTGTPSMGGIGIIAATLLSLISLPLLISTLEKIQGFPVAGKPHWVNVVSIYVLPLVLLLHGMLGFADDWSKASGRGGLRARTKLAGQIILAFAFVAIVAMFSIVVATYNKPGDLDVFHWLIDNGLLLKSAVLMFVVIAVCNAVNLTDGIDGLAAGLAVQCGLTLFIAGPYFRSFPEHSISFWMALAGACLGFLFFNRYPARVFMGDTGSLAIGAALGAGAILQGAVFLLPFIGFIYFVEMFSVIAQVLWFKWTKRKTGEGQRLFRRAPLHHHFELSGWSEWRVVATFWAVNLFTSIVGLWLWKAGVLPRWP